MAYDNPPSSLPGVRQGRGEGGGALGARGRAGCAPATCAAVGGPGGPWRPAAQRCLCGRGRRRPAGATLRAPGAHSALSPSVPGAGQVN